MHVMKFEAVDSRRLDASSRRALRELWAAAYGDRFSDDDADHAYGGVHVIAYDGLIPIAHASAIPRQIRFGEKWQETAYVEAVATAPARQHSGVGTAVMRRLHDQIRNRWPVAMLSTGRAAGFYERLGWERWGGASFTLTEAGARPDNEHGGLMVLRLDPLAVPDLTVDVTCKDRPGDAW